MSAADPMMKKLIEGDADECMEVLDHAAKLLNGETVRDIYCGTP